MSIITNVPPIDRALIEITHTTALPWITMLFLLEQLLLTNSVEYSSYCV
jgi:hypothetical protein